MKGLREVIKNINDYNSVFGLRILEDGKELALYLKMGEYAKPLKMFSTK